MHYYEIYSVTYIEYLALAGQRGYNCCLSPRTLNKSRLKNKIGQTESSHHIAPRNVGP